MEDDSFLTEDTKLALGGKITKTRISRSREEKNRLKAQISDLLSQNANLEELNLVLSKQEGKYRQRSQTQKDLVADKVETIRILNLQIASLANEIRAAKALQESEQNKHQNADQNNRSMQEEIHRLRYKLEEQNKTLVAQNNVVNVQLRECLNEIAQVKTELTSHYEQKIIDIKEHYTQQLRAYEIEAAKAQAKEEGILLGKKQEFQKARRQEELEMKKLKLEEQTMHEERLRKKSVNVGAAALAEQRKNPHYTAFTDPRNILTSLVHRMPKQVPTQVKQYLVHKNLKMPRRQKNMSAKENKIGGGVLVTFQLAMARLREFDPPMDGREEEVGEDKEDKEEEEDEVDEVDSIGIIGTVFDVPSMKNEKCNTPPGNNEYEALDDIIDGNLNECEVDRGGDEFVHVETGWC
jgi:myosin heavy subunit